MIFLLLPTYPISTSTVTSSSSEKKSAVSKTLFFSFHLRCCKNENLWWFSPYPVTTTIIWPTTDRIPHSVIFKRMQIKRIADNIRAFSFLLTNWNKEPDEERICRWTKFFTGWTIANEKCTRAHVQQNKSIYLSIYISIWKPFFFLFLLFWLFRRFWLTQIPRTILHHQLALTKFGKLLRYEKNDVNSKAYM